MTGILIIIAAFCIAYFLLVAVYTSMNSMFPLFWLMLGGLCLLLAGLLECADRGIIPHISSYLRIVIFTVAAVIVMIVLMVEGQILSKMYAEPPANVDYLIVLGAQVNGRTVSGSLKRRLDKAVEYLQENPNTIVLVSGGQGSGEDISEAEAMFEYLVGAGINAGRIVRESRSTSTIENLQYCARIIGTDSSVGIVSNGFHIYRALKMAQHCGFREAYGVAASTDPLLELNYLAREFFAVMKAKITGNIG